MGTINTTRAMRQGSAPGISGARAESVNNVQSPDQVISAASEEQTALAAFLDHQLRGLCLISDQQANVRYLGTRFNVVSTTAAAVFPGVMHAGGDLTDDLYPGDMIVVRDTVADDGTYLVATIAFGADTTITLEDGHEFPGAGGGAVGTVARLASRQQIGYAYPITSVAINGNVVVAWDVSDKFFIADATATPPVRASWAVVQGTVANDGFFSVTGVDAVALPGQTTLQLNGGVMAAAAGAAGWITLCRDAFELEANEPYLWDYASGIQNPFIHQAIGAQGIEPIFVDILRGQVDYSLVENLHATVNANYDARLALNPDIH